MDTAIFYSDTAIIIYELIVICVMGFFIRKLSKEKKDYILSQRKHDSKLQEDSLKKQLANDKWREEA